MSDYRKPSDLPAIIPVFPLTGAILFARWSLPLNIFEPRYLNMIDDAMYGQRIIGMIQPRGEEGDALAAVGCAGRITSYTETPDGRYLITLSGICRFRVVREIDARKPYRQVEADYTPFAGDLVPPPPVPTTSGAPDRDVLIAALRGYLERSSLKAEWSGIDDAPFEMLVNALSAGCPFGPVEKQALMEAPTLADRAATLVALLRMDTGQAEDGWLQ